MESENLKMKLKKIAAENSIFSFNQKILKAEIKRIDLEKRQYENNYLHEKRKVLTKFARTLTLSNAFTTRSRSLRNESSFLSDSNYQQDFKSPPSTPSHSINRLSSLNDMRQEEELPKKKNKSVYWQDNMERLGREASQLSLEPPKKESSVILPRVMVITRSSSIGKSFLGTTKLPDIFNEQKKLSQNNSQKFLNSLSDDDSGFYVCTNSRGQPLCDGYDNYGNLLNSTPNAPYTFANKVAEEKTFRNPFEYNFASGLDLPNKKRVNFGESNDEEVKKNSQGQLKKHSFKPSSANLFKLNLMRRKKEEDDKICNDTFRAQTIRSLTLKEVDIY